MKKWNETNMKKLNQMMLGTVAISLLAIGCGKGISGTFKVLQSSVGGNLSGNCANSQLDLNISENGNAISGSGSNSCFSSVTLQGTDDGDGHVTNVIYMFTLASQTGTNNNMNYPYNNNSNSSCIYTGSLNLSDKVISGSLNQQQNGNSNYNNSYNFYGCPTSVYINGQIK
jgi:hypothetical protein